MLLTTLALAGVLHAPASAQEFANVAGLHDALASIQVQAMVLKLAQGLPEPTMAAAAAAAVPARPDVSAYKTRGIDVSAYQKKVDWSKVKKAGIAFAFIKATEGAEDADANFKDNWDGAAKAGLTRGAYHFYNFCKTGSEQADNFIKTVPASGDMLPMTIDLEESRDCAKMPEKDPFLKDLAAFVDKIKTAYGLAPILYINYGIYDRYLSGNTDYKLWVSDPRHKAPMLPKGVDWSFWQYSYRGKVAGISEPVDLDVFSGDLDGLASLQTPATPPAPAPVAVATNQ